MKELPKGNKQAAAIFILKLKWHDHLRRLVDFECVIWLLKIGYGMKMLDYDSMKVMFD